MWPQTTQSIAGVLLFGLMTACANTRPPTESMDPIVAQARDTSLYANSVDWTVVSARYQELTKGKTSPVDLRPGLEFLINALGDRHGAFRSAEDFSIVAAYSGPPNENDHRDADFVDRVINDISAQFSYRQVGSALGYLRVVGIGPGRSVKENADQIRAGLLALANRGIKKWIVDLRFNGGGNMNPMIAGLAPLIGDGPIGGLQNAQGERVRHYTIRDGQFFDSGNLVSEMPNQPLIDESQKVAVLVSRYTISSGELVAVAFKGRENTLFIGEPSAGYTTATGYDQVRDDLFMMISQSVFVDRNGTPYEHRVGIDIPMIFEPTDSLDDDKQISEAVRWLSN
ncbi:MAG: S41 family peptidase [Lysobacterales bacterium]